MHKNRTGTPVLPATSALPGTFLIQTVLKKNYLTAVGGGGRITDVVHTNATQPRSTEKFRLIPYPQVGGSSTPGSFAIQTASGNYLTAVSGGGRTTDVLHTDALQVQAWEKFRLRDQGNGTYTIQTVKGNYLGAGPISTNMTDPNSAYRFRLIMYNF